MILQNRCANQNLVATPRWAHVDLGERVLLAVLPSFRTYHIASRVQRSTSTLTCLCMSNRHTAAFQHIGVYQAQACWIAVHAEHTSPITATTRARCIFTTPVLDGYACPQFVPRVGMLNWRGHQTYITGSHATRRLSPITEICGSLNCMRIAGECVNDATFSVRT